MFFRPWSALHLGLHILRCEDRIQIIYDKMLRSVVVNNHLIGPFIAHSLLHGNTIFFANFRRPFCVLSVWRERPFHHSNFREPRKDS